VGDLTNVSYSDANPTVSLAYDADNRLTNMIDGIGATSYAYDGAGQLLSEGGPWQDDIVSYTYNNRLRTGMSIQQPDADAWAQTYSYDGARRMTNTISPAGNFGYTYDPTCQTLVGKLTLPNGSNITNTYDGNARLLSTELLNSSATILNSHSYVYNVGNQRTQQTFTAANYDTYTYDKIGQLTAATGTEFGGVTNRLLEQLRYGYDAAHNLSKRTNNALVEYFNVNNLNELSTVTNSGTLTVEGTTGAPATNVTVNGGPAALYSDNTFAEAGFTVTNGNNSFTAIASDGLGRHSTNSVTAYMPATNSFTYDLSGNLLYDGLRTFAYDDENQLTSVLVSNAWQNQFLYDGRMRRRVRREYAWQSGGWVQTNEVRYIYDGNVVVQERDINNLPVTTYTRGKDLSGYLQGAGGIGGMLAFSQPSTVTPQHYYYHADGNGNITALLNAAQIVVAKYFYDPFGKTLALSGPIAALNHYQFSSKETDLNSDLIYYLYRFYDPNLQVWVTRDPQGEEGGINLYSYVGNFPSDSVDTDGRGAWGTAIGGTVGGIGGSLFGGTVGTLALPGGGTIAGADAGGAAGAAAGAAIGNGLENLWNILTGKDKPQYGFGQGSEDCVPLQPNKGSHKAALRKCLENMQAEDEARMDGGKPPMTQAERDEFLKACLAKDNLRPPH
jgi:RHS repeat-associated protein